VIRVVVAFVIDVNTGRYGRTNPDRDFLVPVTGVDSVEETHVVQVVGIVDLEAESVFRIMHTLRSVGTIIEHVDFQFGDISRGVIHSQVSARCKCIVCNAAEELDLISILDSLQGAMHSKAILLSISIAEYCKDFIL
jgi:hypothetical protein